MKLIELSKTGKLAGKYFAQVDDEDYERLIQFNWYVKKRNRNLYAERVIYISAKRAGTKKMHQEIVSAESGMVIDHFDRNGLNNQRYNLRVCTHKQNCANTRARGKGSKYKGVTFNDGYFYKTKSGEKKYCVNKKKWVVQVGAMGKGGKWIGVYLTEKEAALSYNQEAIKLYGEFANLNVIDE